MKVTVCCKLNPDKKQIKILDKTLSKCLEALNYVSGIAWKKKCFGRVALHHLTYYKVKSKFKLSAQMVTSVRDKVSYSYKAEKEKQHIFKHPILPLNFPRTVSLKGLEIVSISTISGRQKIPLALGEYQKQMLAKATKYCDSVLIKRDKKFYLNICIEILDEPLKDTKDVIGIDMGIKNLATCSTGDNFTGEHVQSVCNRYQALRTVLQSKGSRSAKRHLKKMSGREKRFQKNTNHCISNQIIKLAQEANSAIALEDLTNIRKTAKHKKAYRGIFHRWAFYQLREFISYKAQRVGVPVLIVNPAYTSQVCSVCGNLGVRSGQSFHCLACSFQADSDFNAAINISKIAVVNQRIVSPVEAKAHMGIADEGSYKPTAF